MEPYAVVAFVDVVQVDGAYRTRLATLSIPMKDVPKAIAQGWELLLTDADVPYTGDILIPPPQSNPSRTQADGFGEDTHD